MEACPFCGERKFTKTSVGIIFDCGTFHDFEDNDQGKLCQERTVANIDFANMYNEPPALAIWDVPDEIGNYYSGLDLEYGI